MKKLPRVPPFDSGQNPGVLAMVAQAEVKCFSLAPTGSVRAGSASKGLLLLLRSRRGFHLPVQEGLLSASPRSSVVSELTRISEVS